jgi:hypothetical protein
VRFVTLFVATALLAVGCSAYEGDLAPAPALDAEPPPADAFEAGTENDASQPGLCSPGFASCDPNAATPCAARLDTLPNCGSCNESCTEIGANDCTKDSCTGTGVGSCKHYDWGNCAVPGKVGACNLPAACRHDDDGDGLTNEWEMNGGVDLNCDGVYDASEKMLTNVDPGNPLGASASPTMKDVFVEYDYMVLPDQGTPCTIAPQANFPAFSPDCDFDQYCINSVCRGHSDAPSAAAVEYVVAAFRAKSINLHIDPVHQALPHSHVSRYGTPLAGCSAPDAATLAKPRRAVDFYSIKNNPLYYDRAHRDPAFHYFIFAHLHTCDSAADCATCFPQQTFRSSGLAEIIGNDGIVSYGGRFDATGGASPPTTLNQASTFMHELGHNLGLDHGGPYGLPDSTTNNKPNYLSVMGFAYQLSGISRSATAGSTAIFETRVDYQDIAPGGAILPVLNESGALDETTGINSGTNDIAYYFCPARTPGPGTGPINWDCDNASALVTNASGDINNGDGTMLRSYRDWPNLVFGFQCSASGNFLDGASPQVVTRDDIDWHTAEAEGLLYPVLTVTMDVRPSSSSSAEQSEHAEHCVASGRPCGDVVTVFGSNDLDVTHVVPSSLRFRGVAPSSIRIADLDSDGRPDLEITSPTSARGPSTRSCTLAGHLDTSQRFTASCFR